MVMKARGKQLIREGRWESVTGNALTTEKGDVGRGSGDEEALGWEHSGAQHGCLGVGKRAGG